MATERFYRTDQYMTICTSRITGVRVRDGFDTIACESSVFYPEGGGQPSDRGTVSRRDSVYAVTEAHDDGLEGDVWHYTDAPEGTFSPGDEVTLEIDRELRLEHMERHLGEHMLSGAMYRLHGGVNKGFHMGEDYITIDIDLGGRMLTEEELAAAARDVNDAVRADLPVTVTWFDSYEASEVMPVRKAVPHEGRVSVVTVGDLNDPYDCIACCGTHPSSTGQAGPVAIYKCEPNKGMNRIFFDCGRKALSKLTGDSALLADIARRYSCSTADLPARLERESAHAASLKARLASLASYAAEIEKAVILRGMEDNPGAAFTYKSEIFSTDELLKLGFSVTGEVQGAFLILMQPEEKTCLLLSSGDLKCGRLVKEIAGRFGGRGGGRDNNARAVFGSAADMEAFARAAADMVQ